MVVLLLLYLNYLGQFFCALLYSAFRYLKYISESVLEAMSSVLNVGVMRSNPVGNQIRRLETSLEAERKDKQMLLLALETKAPEVFAEYMRLKEEAEERTAAVLRLQQAALNPPQRFQTSGSLRNNPASRF
jgi:hypothetical protein